MYVYVYRVSRLEELVGADAVRSKRLFHPQHRALDHVRGRSTKSSRPKSRFGTRES